MTCVPPDSCVRWNGGVRTDARRERDVGTPGIELQHWSPVIGVEATARDDVSWSAGMLISTQGLMSIVWVWFRCVLIMCKDIYIDIYICHLFTQFILLITTVWHSWAFKFVLNSAIINSVLCIQLHSKWMCLNRCPTADWRLIRWLLVTLHEISHYHQHPILRANGITAELVNCSNPPLPLPPSSTPLAELAATARCALAARDLSLIWHSEQWGEPSEPISALHGRSLFWSLVTIRKTHSLVT